MEYRLLGTTGVTVSALCMGTMTFGAQADKTESMAMFDACLEAGINFFDCANKYADGRAETILGECIKNCRNDVVITTKAASRTGPGKNDLGASRRHLMLELEKSLKRLQTDRIDVYFIHYFDPATSMEDTLRFLDDAVRQGKIIYTGMSNWAAWQIMKALHLCRMNHLKTVDCIQPMYNLVKRQAEVEIFPMAQDQNLGVISYSPLGAGVLTGKYKNRNGLHTARLNEKEYYDQRYSDPRYFEVANAFVGLADELGYNPVPLAICWAMSHPAVTAPIIGARNFDQLKTVLEAVDIDLTPRMREQISSVSITPSPAHDRLEELRDKKNRLR